MMTNKPVSLPELNLDFYIKNGRINLSSSYRGETDMGSVVAENISYEGIGTQEMGVYVARQITSLAYTFQKGFVFPSENIQEFLPGMEVHPVENTDTSYSLPVGKASLLCEYRQDGLFNITLKMDSKDTSRYEGITPRDMGKILSFEIYEKGRSEAPRYGVQIEDHGIEL